MHVLLSLTGKEGSENSPLPMESFDARSGGAYERVKSLKMLVYGGPKDASCEFGTRTSATGFSAVRLEPRQREGRVSQAGSASWAISLRLI